MGKLTEVERYRRRIALERYLVSRDERDMESLISEYHRMFRDVLRKFHIPPGEDADLEQVAKIGFLTALNRYRGGAFDSFAYRHIWGAVSHYLRDYGSLIRTPPGRQPYRFCGLDGLEQ